MKPDDECQHLIVTRWIESKTGKPVDLWSCEDCRRRFEPVIAAKLQELEQDEEEI